MSRNQQGELLGGRRTEIGLELGLRDNAVERWARESIVVRLVPTGAVALPADISTSIPRTSPHLSH